MWMCLFFLLVLPATQACDDLFGLKGGNTFVANALNLITVGSNFGTLAGPTAVGFASMSASQISSVISSTMSGNSKDCKMKQLKNWVIDNFLSLEEWNTWKVDHEINMNNMFNDFQLIDFTVDKNFFQNTDHIDPKSSDANWISDYIGEARNSLRGITSAVVDIFNRSKKFVKSNNNKDKSTLMSNMLLMAELIVEGNLLVTQMHQVSEGCKDRCSRDMGIQVARDIFDWEKFIWRVEHEFMHVRENLEQWKTELRHYHYSQDSEDNEHVLKNQKKGYQGYCNGKVSTSFNCKFTIKIKDGDWTCWYFDHSFGVLEFIHAGNFIGSEAEYTHFDRWCRKRGFAHRQSICNKKRAEEHHFDDDICNSNADNWPKRDAAEYQAWRLGETLWKLQIETFAHLADNRFSNYWTAPWEDYDWETYAAPVKFQWTVDLVYNMACELCNSYDPNFLECKQRCKKNEKWILNRKLSDDDAQWNSGWRSYLLNMDLCPHNDPDNYTPYFSMCEGNRRKLKKVDEAKPKGNKHSPKGRKRPKDKKINSAVMDYMGHKIEALKSELKEQLQDQKEEEFSFRSEMNEIGENELGSGDNRRKL